MDIKVTLFVTQQIVTPLIEQNVLHFWMGDGVFILLHFLSALIAPAMQQGSTRVLRILF